MNAGVGSTRIWRAASVLLVLLASRIVAAGEVAVLAAEFARQGPERWRVSVTLEHADSGWEHYADAWRIVSEDGEVLGTRTLYHPHEHEQPFTRALDGVRIPRDVARVLVEAHDSVHGWATRRLEVDLAAGADGVVRVER